MSNLYRILGVSETASEEEIKKAYKTLSKKYHPDANPGNREAEAHFREISGAYAVLQNPQKRQEYDKALQKNRNRKENFRGRADTGPSGRKHAAPFGGNGNMDFRSMEEQFQQFFGFRPKTGKPDKDNIHADGKAKTNPIDMTEMFERYMGIKK